MCNQSVEHSRCTPVRNTRTTVRYWAPFGNWPSDCTMLRGETTRFSYGRTCSSTSHLCFHIQRDKTMLLLLSKHPTIEHSEDGSRDEWKDVSHPDCINLPASVTDLSPTHFLFPPRQNETTKRQQFIQEICTQFTNLFLSRPASKIPSVNMIASSSN